MKVFYGTIAIYSRVTDVPRLVSRRRRTPLLQVLRQSTEPIATIFAIISS